MTAALLTALFLASAASAFIAIAVTWQQYGAKALRLHGELRNCQELRDISVRIAEVQVKATGRVLRPAFTNASKVSASGLRAAA